MQRIMSAMAHGLATIGGLVLAAIVVMTCLSVIGREIGIGEITGNYEILEAGIAFAIFSFFPICQLYGSHATVDVFTSGLGEKTLTWLRAFWEVVLAIVIVVISWRLYSGVERYLKNGETTLFLEFPVWWAYGASFCASAIAALVAVWCAYARVSEAMGGQSLLPASED